MNIRDKLKGFCCDCECNDRLNISNNAILPKVRITLAGLDNFVTAMELYFERPRGLESNLVFNVMHVIIGSPKIPCVWKISYPCAGEII